MSDQPLQRRTRSDRERLEEALSPIATRASSTKGREHPEEPDDLRTCFERDRDRILHAKAFRRLKHKTQVFIAPEGDHVVTRLTHTLNVAQVGRSIANGLGLNEALTEAICLGHDLGHAPFGHTGEGALTPFMPPGMEWLHAFQSVRIVRKLEPLNLTWEVRDGIWCSSWRNPEPATPEGWVCRFADRIAYLAHDALDAVRAGVLRTQDLPTDAVALLGAPGSGWIDRLLRAVVDHSVEAGVVAMQPDHADAMQVLRDFMFERVYLRGDAQEQARKAVTVIRDLVEWFAERPDLIAPGYCLPGDAPVQQAIDYVAGMTDRYAIREHDRLFRPLGAF